MTALVLFIPFGLLRACYVVLIDWEALRDRLKQWLPDGSELTLCTGPDLASRAALVAKALDVLDLLRVSSAPHSRLLVENRSGHASTGREALRQLSFRVPLAAPFLLMAIACAPRGSAAPRPVNIVEEESYSDPAWIRIVRGLVAGSVFSAIAYTGFRRIYSAWPFSVYPTFATRYSDSVTTLAFGAVDGHGQEIRLEDAIAKTVVQVDPVRWKFRLNELLKSGSVAQARSGAFDIWQHLLAIDPALHRARELRVFIVRDSVRPELWRSNPITKDLWFSIALGPRGPLPLL
jgi:hypothetical protein